MSQTYYAILTAVGEAKLANAAALGTQLQISRMAVGDGGGVLPTPNRTQTALISEQYRADLNELKPDPVNASQLIAELVIPETTGGFWIREMGLYDSAGALIAVSNCPPSYKPQMSEGSGRTQVLRMVLIVSSTAAVQLKIDPSVVLATREYVVTTVAAELAKLDNKQSVRVATTGTIALSGLQTIDGITLAAGDRVLVKDQGTASLNGIYTVAAGSWARSADADASVEVTPGLLVPVEQGTSNGDSLWQLVTDLPIALGTTALSFEIAAGPSGIAAGTYRSVTVDKRGRVTGGTNPTTLAGYGITDALNIGAPSLQHPVLASAQTGTTYQHTAFEVREALADASGDQSEEKAPSIGWHWGGLLGVRMWMNSAGRLMWGGAAFHDTSTGATQAQAEDGTNETAWMSPLRVFQAIAKKVVQASEAVLGVAKVATSAQVADGTDDATIVTPKKLRMGFSISLGNNGYVAFPTWLGGLIIQWGLVAIATSGSGAPSGSGNGSGGYSDVSFPLAFPVGALSILASQNASQAIYGGYSVVATILSKTGARVILDDNYQATYGTYYANWLAIGY